jgi:hypothetical protein
MSPNKHTPGPWVVKGRLVEAPSRLDLGVAQAIAGMTAGSRGASQITVPEAEANARLIAAAPDMLEALKTIGALLAGRPKTIKDDELWGAFSYIIAAVAKAENTTPLNAEGGDK